MPCQRGLELFEEHSSYPFVGTLNFTILCGYQNKENADVSSNVYRPNGTYAAYLPVLTFLLPGLGAIECKSS